MSEKIIDLNEHRPHFRITGSDGNEYVIPAQFFEEVVSGETLLSEVGKDLDAVFPVIIKEWLLLHGIGD